jgi:hypothetical protein
MKAIGKTVMEILSNVPPERVEPFNKLHETIVKNLPQDLNLPSVMVDWVMLSPIHFIQTDTIASQVNLFRLQE